MTRIGKSYIEYFHADKTLEGINIMDYPLIPYDERERVACGLEICLKNKIEVIGGNHAEWTDRDGDSHQAWLRWRNVPQLDGDRCIGILSYGQIISRVKSHIRGPQYAGLEKILRR